MRGPGGGRPAERRGAQRSAGPQGRPRGRAAWLVLAAALAAAGAGHAGAAAADLPPGDALLGYQVRHTHTDDPTVSPDTTTEHDFGLFLTQELPNYGLLRAEGHWYDPAGRGGERGWSHVSLGGLRTGGAALAAHLGDTVVEAGLLPRRLLVLVEPGFNLEGGRLDLAAGSGAVTLFAGDAIARTGSFATGIERLGERLAGLRLRQRLGERATLSGFYLHSEGRGTLGTTTVPAANDSAGVGADVRVAGPLALVGELRLSARGAGPAGAETDGLSYVVGPLVERPGLRLEAAAFSLDPAYLPVERALVVADRRGAFGAFAWDGGPAIGLFGSALRQRNNLAGDPAVTTIETTQAILGGRGRLPAPWPVLLVARGELTRLESLASPALPVESTTRSLVAELSQVIGTWRPVLRARLARLDDEVFGERATTTDLTGEVWWEVTRRARIWTVGQWVRVSATPGLSDSTRYLGRVGGEQRLSAALFVRGEAEVTALKEAGVSSSRLGVSASLGYRHRLFDLFADLRRNWVDTAGAEEAHTEDVAYLRVVVPLRWGRPVLPAAGRPAGGAAAGWGTIRGAAFLDRNGNGRRDPDEPGVAGLRVLLDGLAASAVETGEDGSYRFDRVAVGPHSVRLEVRRLPADYDLVSQQFVEVAVAQRQVHTVDFVIQPLGRIAGRIRRVQVGDDGQRRPAGPAAAVAVLLRRGEEIWQSFADDEGRFEFGNVRAGDYELLLDPAALP
ncbi:MAG TPA: SdrD B-like domain-containing protein, partial [Thermodesulfobacteriota bacterium]|nr:SdrD B-like domain-containing protein [Thermodesulfobacteriota bacterium]